MLYQGIVTQYFMKDDQLIGIFLQDPRRFDRQGYLKDKETYTQAIEKRDKPKADDYWRSIPSQNLYFFVEKIINMNLSYITPEGTVASTEAIGRLLAEVLGTRLDLSKITISQHKRPSPIVE
jgi:hypothetical protein